MLEYAASPIQYNLMTKKVKKAFYGNLHSKARVISFSCLNKRSKIFKGIIIAHCMEGPIQIFPQLWNKTRIQSSALSTIETIKNEYHGLVYT